MEQLYKVVFDYNHWLPKFVKKVIEKEFLERRRRAVEKLNPRYELWNKDFFTNNPDLDGDSEEYIDFIQEKQDKVLNSINLMPIYCDLVKLMTDIDKEPGDIMGTLYLCPAIEIRLYLVKVEV